MTNLVLIMADQLRYDALACLGNPVARTPALDSLAARGTRFRRHFTPNQICSPSRGTIFSGLYARHHKMHRNGVLLDPGLELLSHALERRDYRTYGVGKFHFQPMAASAEHALPESWAFWEDGRDPQWRGPFYGFEAVDFVIGESAYVTQGGHYARWLKEAHPEAVAGYAPENALAPPPADLDEVWQCAVPAELHYNSWIADHAVDFVESLPAGERFFLFASFPDPHHPFSPPLPYCARYDPAAMPLPRVVSGELDRMPAYIREAAWLAAGAEVADAKASYLDCVLSSSEPREQGFMIRTEAISEATLGRAIAHTYAMIEMIDDCVGRLLAALAARDLLDDTVIVFTSDHGELLGDHGLLHKGPPPYRQLVQVPLLLAGPGVPKGEVAALTSHLDLKASCLDLLGAAGDPGDGASLVPLLQGKADRIRDALFCEYHPRAVPAQYNQTVITEDWRFTRYPQSEGWGELFDRRRDPGEHHNLYGEPAQQDEATRLGALLDARLPACPEIDAPALANY